jgi:predicted dehydrogenase
LVADLQSTDGVTVNAIASRTEDRAKWFADQYGIPAPVTGYQALLQRDDVDAVYIALPPSLHHQWAIAAASAGKHVLCEKPLAINSAQASEIAAAASKHRVRWIDATAWLHHPRTTAIADQIAAGRIGKLGHISAAVSFYRPFQSDDHRLSANLGGGCLLDLGWYAGGLIRFAAGELPRKVFASAITESGVPIRVNAMLWFDDSVTASLSCGFDTATRKWFEIAGSDASVVCDDFTRPWQNNDGPDKPARCWIHSASGSVEQLAFDGNQERLMIECLTGDGPLDKFQHQAIDTQRMIQAIDQSIHSGEVVTLKAGAS